MTVYIKKILILNLVLYFFYENNLKFDNKAYEKRHKLIKLLII